MYYNVQKYYYYSSLALFFFFFLIYPSTKCFTRGLLACPCGQVLRTPLAWWHFHLSTFRPKVAQAAGIPCGSSTRSTLHPSSVTSAVFTHQDGLEVQFKQPPAKSNADLHGQPLTRTMQVFQLKYHYNQFCLSTELQLNPQCCILVFFSP